MDRRGFLKRIGAVAAVATLAPAVLVAAEATTIAWAGQGLMAQMEASKVCIYEDFDIEELEAMLRDMSVRSCSAQWKIYTKGKYYTNAWIE